jgi:hypothetical protein
MLAGGTITARIRWTVELADVGQIFATGSLSGKAVIRL